MFDSELLRLQLACDRLAPGRARDAIRQLDGLGPTREDAVLLVSELVSSAVLERGCDSGETIELIAGELPHGLKLTVATEAGGPRSLRSGELPAFVVGSLARRWGVERGDGGAQLWAELIR